MKKLTLFFSLLLIVTVSNKSEASTMFKGISLTDTITKSDYIIFGKSNNIESIKVRRSKKPGNVLYLKIGIRKLNGANDNATAYGTVGSSKSKEEKNQTGPIFDKIEVLSGSYEDIKVDKLSSSQNEFTLQNIKFPLRLKMHTENDYIEFELKEAGRWTMDVKYKK